VSDVKMSADVALPTTDDEWRKFLKRAHTGDASTLPALRKILETPAGVDALGGKLAEQAERSLVMAAVGDDLALWVAAIVVRVAGHCRALAGAVHRLLPPFTDSGVVGPAHPQVVVGACQVEHVARVGRVPGQLLLQDGGVPFPARLPAGGPVSAVYVVPDGQGVRSRPFSDVA
jgi:hypothetical protein